MRRYTVAIFSTLLAFMCLGHELAHWAGSRQNLLTWMDIQVAMGNRATINVAPCLHSTESAYIWQKKHLSSNHVQ